MYRLVMDSITPEMLNKENYYKYLGAEAIEGERRPDEQPADDAREFISAVVRAENIYDEKGQYIGQDLIFTFVSALA